MKRQIFYLLAVLLSLFKIEANMKHRKFFLTPVWREENIFPFNELILSWNGMRPPEGEFQFFISVKIDDWSPWLLYSSWGSEGQSSFFQSCEQASVQVFQDAFKVLSNKKATGFQIKIEMTGGAKLENINGLHVYTNGETKKAVPSNLLNVASLFLNVKGISQMTLNCARHKDLCSPTSTTAVTRYLSKKDAIDPISFASHVWDSGFDIFGNWVLNLAEASTHLSSEWSCWVERVDGFDEIYKQLIEGIPVIVSVRGPLKGGALPYSKGHLLAIIGYDASHSKVICMDPAFPSDDETLVSYDLEDFMQAWNRRGNIAYIFRKGVFLQDPTCDSEILSESL